MNSRKQQIGAEADRKVAEIDTELTDVDRAIKTLNDAVEDYPCNTCGGEGTIRKPDAAGQMEDCRCPACNGTGVCPL